ncbi:hypothetical protein EDC19_1172 [Natranaerovirga hydrolytica]|uniref:Uncharacterized protein n=1 Tax=Natranaerovirga hydrolytica TaxID=680378 RepID=A0A4R1MZH6_9FIRM|nr:hypothetical protein [Natranaerovirga hydrolytica]TCK98737.1 hypothetical protein EDC19_1172 [Natranaerovirga hydrolytica]
MEFFGLIAFVLLLAYSSYPARVKKLERKLNLIKRKMKGDYTMSKLMQTLIGEKCLIKVENEENALASIGSATLICTVVDVDDEWAKVTYKDKKEVVKTKMIRIDNIGSIELMNPSIEQA